MIETFWSEARPTRVAMRAQLGIVSKEQKATWVHVANAGSWDGHSSGSFDLTPEIFASVIKNFEEQANPIPFTYEHPAHAGDGNPIPAAGWIHKFATQSNGSQLWALVEFTSRARTHIAEGEYRFCSIVIDLESTDRRTGKPIGPEIYEVGLTNVPFIDGLTPIKLSRRAPGKVRKMSDREIMAEALKALGDDATIEQISEWASHRKAQLAVESGEESKEEAPAEEAAVSHVEAVPAAVPPAPEAVAAAEGDPAPDAEEAPAGDAASKVIEMLASASGLDAAGVLAALEQNADAIAQMLSGSASEEVPTLSRERVAALEAELEQLKTEAAGAKIDAAIAAGRFSDTQREHLVSLAKKAPEALDGLIASAPQSVPTGRAYVSRDAAAGLSESFTEDGLNDTGRAVFAGLRELMRKGAITRDAALKLAHEKQRNGKKSARA
jgi:phage I-like protein